MQRHNKFAEATVMAGFNSQFEAEDALLGLRMAGFRDNQIGYYCLTRDGDMVDYLANYHRVAAAIIWGLVGVAGGLVFAWLVYAGGSGLYQDLGGLCLTSGTIGALLMGMLGGYAGLNRPAAGTYITLPDGLAEPYVLAVDAPQPQPWMWDILLKHGGHKVPLETPQNLPAAAAAL